MNYKLFCLQNNVLTNKIHRQEIHSCFFALFNKKQNSLLKVFDGSKFNLYRFIEQDFLLLSSDGVCILKAIH